MSTTKRYWPMLLVAAGGAFLAMLDTTVTNLAVPDLQRSFPAASVTELSWVVSGYTACFAALLAPAGRLADVLGRRRLFVLGVALFTVASVACALSPSLVVLIPARVVAGAGAAAMIPASLAIMLLDGPADRRPQSIALWSAASALAAAVGPSVGGVLVSAFGWPSVFLINLPLGVIVVVGAMRLLPDSTPVEPARFPDPLGTVLLAVAVGALTLAVTEGGTWGWTSAATLGCFVGGVAAGVVVVLRSRRHPKPVIETSLWNNRTFSSANVIALFYGLAQYAWLLGGVLYLTEIWGYSVLQAGLANTPGALIASATALTLSRKSARIGGPRSALIIGLVAFGACAVWFSVGLLDHPDFLAFWLPASVLIGIGMGAATMGTAAAAATSVPPTAFAAASGTNTTARQFGGAIGVAVMAVLLDLAGPAGRDVDTFSNVFRFCAVMVVVALVLTLVWMRAPRPTPAATESTPSTGPGSGAVSIETTSRGEA